MVCLPAFFFFDFEESDLLALEVDKDEGDCGRPLEVRPCSLLDMSSNLNVNYSRSGHEQWDRNGVEEVGG